MMQKKKSKQLGLIRLHNAVFYAYHGVLDDEQHLGGKFEVDVDLYCRLDAAVKHDALKHTVNYERVYDCVKTLVVNRKYFLIEALAGTIAHELLKNFRLIERAVVRVRKPGAPIKGVIDYVEVELTETRKP
jgi:dihydroneopterin aldolase